MKKAELLSMVGVGQLMNVEGIEANTTAHKTVAFFKAEHTLVIRDTGEERTFPVLSFTDGTALRLSNSNLLALMNLIEEDTDELNGQDINLKVVEYHNHITDQKAVRWQIQ